MRRSPRVMLAWVAAIVVLFATVRVVAGDLGALQRRARSLGAEVPVVLAARDLPLGATVASADLRIVRRPSTTVSAGALRDPLAIVGRVVAVALLRDDVVAARHLVPVGASGAGAGVNGIVPVGRRAVHVLVKDGFQPPIGSVVDVLATYDPSITAVTGAPGLASIVARGARVLALAGTDRADDPGPASGPIGSGVTLLVTENEARSVAYAASVGEVTIVLAPVEDACCR